MEVLMQHINAITSLNHEDDEQSLYLEYNAIEQLLCDWKMSDCQKYDKACVLLADKVQYHIHRFSLSVTESVVIHIKDNYIRTNIYMEWLEQNPELFWKIPEHDREAHGYLLMRQLSALSTLINYPSLQKALRDYLFVDQISNAFTHNLLEDNPNIDVIYSNVDLTLSEVIHRARYQQNYDIPWPMALELLVRNDEFKKYEKQLWAKQFYENVYRNTYDGIIRYESSQEEPLVITVVRSFQQGVWRDDFFNISPAIHTMAYRILRHDPLYKELWPEEVNNSEAFLAQQCHTLHGKEPNLHFS